MKDYLGKKEICCVCNANMTSIHAEIAPGHLKRVYQQCEQLQIIQGIDRCIKCDAPGIVEQVALEKSVRHGGHC